MLRPLPKNAARIAISFQNVASRLEPSCDFARICNFFEVEGRPKCNRLGDCGEEPHRNIDYYQCCIVNYIYLPITATESFIFELRKPPYFEKVATFADFGTSTSQNSS